MDAQARAELLDVAWRRQTRWWLWGGATAGALMLAEVMVVVILTGFRDDSSQHDAGWVIALALAIPFLGIGLMFPLFFWGRRRGWAWLQPDPVLGCERARRKRIGRAVRKNQHLDGDDEDLAVDVARRLGTVAKTQLWIAPLFLINVVFQVIESNWLFAVYWALLSLGALVQWRLISARGQRYLARPAAGSADDAVGA